MENETIGFIGGKFLPFHLGHVYAIIAASNQVDKLYVILSSSKNRDREICERDGIKYMSAEVRLSWLGESLNNLDNVEILHIEDEGWDNDYDWEAGANMIKEAIGKPINFVFSSEHSYDEHFRRYYPEAKHIVIDSGRNIVDISATRMRRNLFEYWDKLPECVRSFFVKKVAIVGTESCGKSTLTKKLAKFFNTNYAHEVGREYCEKYSNQLTYDMFNSIAMDHYLLQKKLAQKSNKYLFVDSEAVITQYYLDMYFEGKKSDLIEEIIKLEEYDLVIFLEPDIKWVDDGLRFAGGEEERRKNNIKLKGMFRERDILFIKIDGDYSNRFMKAKNAVDILIQPTGNKIDKFKNDVLEENI